MKLPIAVVSKWRLYLIVVLVGVIGGLYFGSIRSLKQQLKTKEDRISKLQRDIAESDRKSTLDNEEDQEIIRKPDGTVIEKTKRKSSKTESESDKRSKERSVVKETKEAAPALSSYRVGAYVPLTKDLERYKQFIVHGGARLGSSDLWVEGWVDPWARAAGVGLSYEF